MRGALFGLCMTCSEHVWNEEVCNIAIEAAWDRYGKSFSVGNKSDRQNWRHHRFR